MTHTNVEPPASAPIRVGLIGAGGIGSFHGESLAWRIPGATLAAVADPARETAERVASSLDCPYATPDPAQVLKDPSIQAVVIAAPPSVHADLIEAAAGVGKAVFCEKPMAVTLADADRAIEAASAARVPLQVGFNRRFAPGRPAPPTSGASRPAVRGVTYSAASAATSTCFAMPTPASSQTSSTASATGHA